MTDREKLAKVRAEIERLHEESRNKKGALYYRKALRTVLYLIDSMQEEPVSEDWVEELRTKLDSMSKEDFKKVFDKYAVDGTAQTYLPFESIRFIGKPLRELGLKTNNPVKVIIIKEN